MPPKSSCKHLITDGNDNVLDSGLSLAEAEQRLLYYIKHGEDAYIGTEADWKEEINHVTSL